MIPLAPGASICTTAELAAALDKHKVTVCTWANEKPLWRQCRIQRGIWSVQKLRDRGLISSVAAPLAPAEPVAS